MIAAARSPLVARLGWTAGMVGNILIMVWAAVLVTGRISDLSLGRVVVRAPAPAVPAPVPVSSTAPTSPAPSATPAVTGEPVASLPQSEPKASASVTPQTRVAARPAETFQPTGEGARVLGDKIRFRYRNASARKVLVALYLSRTNLIFKDMTREGDVWELNFPTNPGRYRYSLVVDGRWMLDPGNPRKMSDGLGGWNSVVRIP